MAEPDTAEEADATGSTPAEPGTEDSTASTEAPQPALRWDGLVFPMQHQDQTFWCWAAVALSVARF